MLKQRTLLGCAAWRHKRKLTAVGRVSWRWCTTELTKKRGWRSVSELFQICFLAKVPEPSAPNEQIFSHRSVCEMNGMGLSLSEICCLFCCPPCPSRIAAKLAFLPPEPTYTFEVRINILTFEKNLRVIPLKVVGYFISLEPTWSIPNHYNFSSNILSHAQIWHANIHIPALRAISFTTWELRFFEHSAYPCM